VLSQHRERLAADRAGAPEDSHATTRHGAIIERTVANATGTATAPTARPPGVLPARARAPMIDRDAAATRRCWKPR
jgi:hypothetical protein